jgi:hypothetical protein
LAFFCVHLCPAGFWFFERWVHSLNVELHYFYVVFVTLNTQFPDVCMSTYGQELKFFILPMNVIHVTWSYYNISKLLRGKE